MYIRQQPIFSFEEILQFEPEGKLAKIFSHIDLSEVLACLPVASKYGPCEHDRKAMLYSMLAMKLENIKTVKALVYRLKSDLFFRYQCGFNVSGRVPSEPTFSRFTDLLIKNEIAQKLFNQVVKQALALNIIEGKNIAIDSSKYESYDAAIPSSRIVNNGQNPNWGSKRDTDGNQIRWFGWKLHIAVDCKSGLPMAVILTPANIADSVMALPLLEKIKAQLKDQLKLDFIIMDAGYDVKNIYAEVQDNYHAQAIIPLNHRGAYAPPEGLNSKGTPICSMGYDMTYWGQEQGYHKFRCPHATGRVDCPYGSNWCSTSNYGMVVKKHTKDDPRMFPVPHRCTQRWQDLYDQITSVERCFAMLKEHLGLNSLTKRGLKKALFNALLSCITMIAGTITAKKAVPRAA